MRFANDEEWQIAMAAVEAAATAPPKVTAERKAAQQEWKRIFARQIDEGVRNGMTEQEAMDQAIYLNRTTTPGEHRRYKEDFEGKTTDYLKPWRKWKGSSRGGLKGKANSKAFRAANKARRQAGLPGTSGGPISRIGKAISKLSGKSDSDGSGLSASQKARHNREAQLTTLRQMKGDPRAEGLRRAVLADNKARLGIGMGGSNSYLRSDFMDFLLEQK